MACGPFRCLTREHFHSESRSEQIYALSLHTKIWPSQIKFNRVGTYNNGGVMSRNAFESKAWYTERYTTSERLIVSRGRVGVDREGG